MGFRYWYEGLLFVFIFGVLIGVPCFLTAIIGSKMFNDLGNFPSKAAQIQLRAAWKLMIIMFVTFLLLAVFFHIFS